MPGANMHIEISCHWLASFSDYISLQQPMLPCCHPSIALRSTILPFKLLLHLFKQHQCPISYTKGTSRLCSNLTGCAVNYAEGQRSCCLKEKNFCFFFTLLCCHCAVFSFVTFECFFFSFSHFMSKTMNSICLDKVVCWEGSLVITSLVCFL